MSLGQKRDISQMLALFFSHERSGVDHHLTGLIIFSIGPRSVIDHMEFSDSVVRFKIYHHYDEK
jgi:hypothetical protein